MEEVIKNKTLKHLKHIDKPEEHTLNITVQGWLAGP